jgi:hypothetical protein
MSLCASEQGLLSRDKLTLRGAGRLFALDRISQRDRGCELLSVFIGAPSLAREQSVLPG